MFTVKCDPGVKASSFKADDKVYISTEKLLPMARFLPAPCVSYLGSPVPSVCCVCVFVCVRDVCCCCM